MIGITNVVLTLNCKVSVICTAFLFLLSQFFLLLCARSANCGKPFWCLNPANRWTNSVDQSIKNRLCMDLFREWHLVRLSLENEWVRKYPDYHPVYGDAPNTSTPFGFFLNFSLGHCGMRNQYIPITYPHLQSGDFSLLPHEGISRESGPLAEGKGDGRTTNVTSKRKR